MAAARREGEPQGEVPGRRRCEGGKAARSAGRGSAPTRDPSVSRVAATRSTLLSSGNKVKEKN